MTHDPLQDSIDPSETLSLHEAHEDHHHESPFWTMLWVFVILVVLTFLTVWTSRMHEIVIGNTTIEFGTTLHILVALTIAVVKAAMVGAYFMHLKYDKPMHTVVMGATIFALVLFIGLTLGDLDARRFAGMKDQQYIVNGGDVHFDKDGNRVKGKGIVETARENAHAEGASPAAGHGDAKTPGGHAQPNAAGTKPAEAPPAKPGGH